MHRSPTHSHGASGRANLVHNCSANQLGGSTTVAVRQLNADKNNLSQK